MSSEKLLFVADGQYHRDPHCSRCREQGTAKCLALNRTPISQALLPVFRGCYKKGGRKAGGVRDVDDYNERVFSSH